MLARYPNHASPMVRELLSDLWIETNIPGGLNSPLGRRLDAYLGGNPNPTLGQVYGTLYDYGLYPRYGVGYGYYRGW